MVLILNEGATKEEIEEIDRILYGRRSVDGKETGLGFDAKKYNGTIPSLGEPLEIQKKMRNEWNRRLFFK